MKTRTAWSMLVALLLALPASAQQTAVEETGPKNRSETDHLIVQWVDGTPPEAVAATEAEGEKFYAALEEMLGHRPPEWIGRVTILLQGPGEGPEGSRLGYPRVDSSGRIHLYQFGPTWHSYLSALAHEMVHVFRFRRQHQPDWFFEEGFAEFASLRIDPSLGGFPWFETPVTIVAGQWLVRGKEIPLTVLRTKHRAINQPCKAQSYSLRSDFFDYLGRARGDAAVIAMASEKRVGDLAQYEKHFGASLESLEESWRQDLRARYQATENAEEVTARYLAGPIKYMRVCESGRDF